MLTSDQRCILSLLRSSLGVEEGTDPGGFSVDESIKSGSLAGEDLAEQTDTLRSTVLRSGILLTVFRTLPDGIQAQLRPKYLAALKQAIIQEHEGAQILSALAAAGLDCIALKGWELRKLYPEPTMRQMADLDILVRPYQFRKIKAVMASLGYASRSESSWKHDNFRKNGVTVEMHKRLTDDSGAVQRWEKEMWSRATATDTPHLLRMTPEDFCVFHFVHMHKDFLNGSLGLRRIADTWLLGRQRMDRDFVSRELEKMGLGAFYARMDRLAKAAMGERPMDEDSEVLLRHAFTYGIYGTDKSYKAGRIAAMGDSVGSGKARSLLAAVFLPYPRMKAQFPVLEKWPVLLPWCWAKRIVRLLMGNWRRNLSKLDYSGISEEDYAEMKRFFEAGGII